MEIDNFKKVQDRLQATILTDVVDTKKDGQGHQLTYLSWASAWNIVLKVAPRASYEIITFGEDKVPYQKTELGYMVWTSITIEGVTKKMWLPVMDFHNEAMLDKPRVIKTKNGEYTVQPADMNDINKAIMRCLVKNLAMFGLGINIYIGEDLPDVNEDRVVPRREVHKCECCGNDILDVGEYTAEKIIMTSMKKFQKKLCYDCAMKQSMESSKQNKEETTNA